MNFLLLDILFFKRIETMKWADNLYVSEKASKRREKIIRRASKNAGLLNVYFITLATNGKDLFDIFDASYLKLLSFRKQDLDVVGIAVNKADALELTIRILTDVYQQTGDVRIRDFFVFSGMDSRNYPRKRRRLWDI